MTASCFMSEGAGRLSEIHLSGANNGRAERVAYGGVSREDCGFQQTKYDCWLDNPTGPRIGAECTTRLFRCLFDGRHHLHRTCCHSVWTDFQLPSLGNGRERWRRCGERHRNDESADANAD